MSISIRNKVVSKTMDLAIGIAKYIINSTITDRTHHKTGKSEVITLKFANGSVADCFAIESSHDSIDAEIHFDKTSLVYSDGNYQYFKGKVCEKATPLSHPSVEDIENLIALVKD
jgi:maltodextrin utilization protein YvdJ